ncbi:MAG: 3-isopropylmalate dehydratase small subunit [Oceanicaulis sp.]
MEAFTRVAGVAAPLKMANVDTDKIVPSRFLKTVSKSGLDEALFADLRRDPDFILNQAAWRDARILVALDNFGCGSSREHAPWALAAYGVTCIIAPSFAEIFQNNCRNNGILTITLSADEIDALMAIISLPEHNHLAVDLPDQIVTTAAGKAFSFDIAPAHKRFLLEGMNEIDATLTRDAEISAYEARRRSKQPWLSDPLKI